MVSRLPFGDTEPPPLAVCMAGARDRKSSTIVAVKSRTKSEGGTGGEKEPRQRRNVVVIVRPSSCFCCLDSKVMQFPLLLLHKVLRIWNNTPFWCRRLQLLTRPSWLMHTLIGLLMMRCIPISRKIGVISVSKNVYKYCALNSG